MTEEIKGSWTKTRNRHCKNNFFLTAYSTLAQAKASCFDKGTICSGVYDANCDGRGPFFACRVGGLESSSTGSCVYEPSSRWPGMSNTVRYNGNVYGTLGDHPVDGTAVRILNQYPSYRSRSTARLYMISVIDGHTDSFWQNPCQRNFLPLPHGCRLAPDTAESRAVVGNHNWDTHVVVLSSGKVYCTKNFAQTDGKNTCRGLPGGPCVDCHPNNGWLSSSNGEFGITDNRCGALILYQCAPTPGELFLRV